MPPFRLAHYSDIHVTLPPSSLARGTLWGKRLVGSLNYLVSRRHRFRGVDGRIAALLRHVDTLAPDHALCTGDLTAISAREEFETCAALFGERLRDPSRLTVLPGNHDRYTADTVRDRLFEQHFDAVCRGTGEGFPFVKRLREDVVLVVADVTRPCGLVDSSGLCGDEQLERLRHVLTDRAHAGSMVLLALHYGLLRSRGERDRPSHGIRDDVKLMALLERDDVQVDLVLHGHMHRPYAVKVGKRWSICAGSATDLHGTCGFNVYDLDPAAKTVAIARHDWRRDSGTYERATTSPYPDTLALGVA